MIWLKFWRFCFQLSVQHLLRFPKAIMNIFAIAANSLVISLLGIISTMLGCGVVPAGQDFLVIELLATIPGVLGYGVMPESQASTRTFNVSGLTNLPVAMVYSTAPDIQAQVPGIASNERGAQAYVRRLVMQTVFDVLESQARSALLPDAVISSILDQITVNIAYVPLNCEKIALNLMEMVMNKERKCVIVGNTVVTGICTHVMNGGKMCKDADGKMVTLTPVPDAHLKISGTLSTTNVIMANWSRMMWQSVVDRAVQMLASGPFRTHFFSARATVSGN